MNLKHKCLFCEETFWLNNNRFGHIFMTHMTELKPRLDAALDAFKNYEPPKVKVER